MLLGEAMTDVCHTEHVVPIWSLTRITIRSRIGRGQKGAMQVVAYRAQTTCVWHGLRCTSGPVSHVPMVASQDEGPLPFRRASWPR